MIDVKAGLAEVKIKTEEAIERASALTWANRSAGCYFLVTKTSDKLAKLKWLMRAEDNRHEALEHSALVEDAGKLLHGLQQELDKFRDEALKSVTG